MFEDPDFAPASALLAEPAYGIQWLRPIEWSGATEAATLCACTSQANAALTLMACRFSPEGQIATVLQGELPDASFVSAAESIPRSWSKQLFFTLDDDEPGLCRVRLFTDGAWQMVVVPTHPAGSR